MKEIEIKKELSHREDSCFGNGDRKYNVDDSKLTDDITIDNDKNSNR